MDAHLFNPCAEASCEMAADAAMGITRRLFLESLESPNETSSTIVDKEPCEPKDTQISPYVPDFDVASRHTTALAVLKRYGTENTDLSESESCDEDAEVQNEVDSSEECRTYDSSDNDTASDYEMGYEMGSRDFTDPDDWVLERIVQRRMNKDSSYGGPWLYLCKWKWYDEPTWEYRETLEDAGWLKAVDEWDAKGGVSNASGLGRRKTKTPLTEEAIKRAQIKRGAQNKISNVIHVAETLFAKDPESFSKLVCGLFKGHYRPYRYAHFNEKLVSELLERANSMRSTHVPLLCFHGTRACNLPSIYETGFIIGGTNGVKVANGSAHGSGVYTAVDNPDVSIGYTNGSQGVLLCVGLVPLTPDVNSVYKIGEFAVFRNAKDVVPLWLIQYRFKYENHDDDKIIRSPPLQVDCKDLMHFIDSGCNMETISPDLAWRMRGHSGTASAAARATGAALTTPTVAGEGSSGACACCEKKSLPENASKCHRFLQDAGVFKANGSISKAALKGQPRKVKDILACVTVPQRK